MLMLLLAGCAPDPVSEEDVVVDTAAPPPAAPLTEPLSAAPLLRRMTIDLAGRLPTPEEVAEVEAAGEVSADRIAALMAEPAFEQRLADLLAEQWLTRADHFNIGHVDYQLDDSLEYGFERAVGDEPLRLMAYVAANDLPWTDIVEADYTIVDPVLLQVWPLEEATDLPEAYNGVPARYTDDRPAGGVVMTNGLWWRYYSAPNNYNRTRAAALSRLLLCDDYLLRPISFTSSTLLDRESLNEATRTETACVGCHATLDPLSVALFGFWWFDLYDVAEMTSYHAEREYLGEYYLELSPAWFGEPMDSPADLGPMIARDPRFVSCAVQTAAEGLWRRDVQLDDFAILDAAASSFEESGLQYRSLLAALVATEPYTAGALLSETTDEEAERFMTRRILSTELLADTIEQLTGYRWMYNGFDQLDNDSYGFRILTGGVDGEAVSQVQHDPSLSRALVIKRLSHAAAWSVVQGDLNDGEGRLLTLVARETNPDEAAFDEQLTRLVQQFHGRTPSADELSDLTGLWVAVEDAQDSLAAWQSVVAVLIRDPAFWMY